MRKLVATLACRNDGSRLYGKPLQNLDIKNKITILDHITNLIRTMSPVEEIVLGVSEGVANKTFLEFAKKKGVKFIVGDEIDVLHRLIQCVEEVNGTDAFRVTTESPFFYYENIEEAWEKHIANSNDLTSFSGVPDGSHYEIFSLETLKKSHELGDNSHRSEMCSKYLKDNQDDFKVEVLSIPENLIRYKDLRLTVDYPEDLIVCREVYNNLKELAPRIPLGKIIEFLDSNSDLKNLVKPFVVPVRLY